MKYAVIQSGGKQYKVTEGDRLEIDRLASEKNEKVVFENVLLLVSENGVKVGTPYVKGEIVEAKLIDNIKGDKIRVSKFKSKVRYRRVTGFRPSLSVIEVEKVGSKKGETTLGKENAGKKS